MSKYSDKQLAFLDALTGEARGNVRAAMREAGYSDATKIGEVVGPLKDEIVDRASLMLAMNAPKATFSMLDVLDDPGAMGARNSVAAAAQILDRTGLVKKEQVTVAGLENGIFILPPKQADTIDGEDTPE